MQTPTPGTRSEDSAHRFTKRCYLLTCLYISQKGNIPLDIATQHNRTAVVEYLQQPMLPIHQACVEGNLPLVKELLAEDPTLCVARSVSWVGVR